jgi:hypothetical protein
MNKETTPEGQKFITGTLGEVFPECFEKVKNDANRFCCLIKTGQCEHEATCFIKLQRTINDMFIADPELVGGKFVWSTDKKRYLTKIPAKTMIHEVFEVREDKYSPLE